MKQVEKKRHLAKTITWRIIASADTFFIAWIITGKFDWASTIAGIEVLTKMFLYSKLFTYTKFTKLVPSSFVKIVKKHFSQHFHSSYCTCPIEFASYQPCYKKSV